MVEQRAISRRCIMISAGAASGALGLVPAKLTARTASVQNLKIQQPRVTAFVDGVGSVGASLQMLEAYAVDADLVIVSVPDARRFRHLTRSLAEVIDVTRKSQSHVLALSQSPAYSPSFVLSRLMGPEGLITPFMDKVGVVSWHTELGVIVATNSEQSDNLDCHSSIGIAHDLIVYYGNASDDFDDAFQENIDPASTAYKVDLQYLGKKGPKIYAPNGQILTQATPGFAQGVTAKINVMAARQARIRSAVARV